jgi:hypothetical protein
VNKGRLTAGALAALAVLACGARAADARIIDLHVSGEAGGIAGWGATSTPDFFDHTRGGAVGFNLGFKLLVFDLSASFTQVLDSSGTSGTLTQFLLATEIDVPVGQDKLPDGQSRNILHPSFGAGFGFGTPGPVSPPLDAAQISDKGIVTQFKFGYEYFLNPFIGVGAEALFGYHWFFIGGVVNDHSSGYHLAGFGKITFHLGI